MRSSFRWRRFLALVFVVLLGGVAIICSFSWGYLAKGRRMFPYAHIHRIFDRPKVRIRKEMHSRSDLPALVALGYVEGVADSVPEKMGVTIYDEKKTQPGFNLYCAPNECVAYLITNSGDTAHSWSLPESLGVSNHCELLPNGDLLAQSGGALYKVDKNATVLWVKHGSYHHCFDVTEEGLILALSRRLEHHKQLHKTSPFLVDYLEIVNQAGQTLREISLLSVVEASRFRYLMPSVHHLSFEENVSIDLLHTNYVEEIDGRTARKSKLFRKGDLIMSFKNLNLIAVLDGKTMEALWMWGPSNLTLPHFPTLLENGHLLLFNNGVDQSEVLEIDPVSYQVVWRYTHEGFFSKFRGAVQRLENGNTLITESDKGYAHEVTPSGGVVWQFANPHFLNDGRRAYIWQVERIPPGRVEFVSSSKVG